MATVAVVTLAARTGPLIGRHVELVPLVADLAADLTVAAAGERSTYRFTEVPDTREAMARLRGVVDRSARQ